MSRETLPVRGVTQVYGPRSPNLENGGRYCTKGGFEQSEWVFQLEDIISGAPTTSNVIKAGTAGNLDNYIPAYAKILSVRAEVVEAITTTGGTAATSASLTFGLEQSDGTDIDLDGLIDATDGALTIAANDIAEPRGTVLVGSNAALVPNVSIGAADGELYALLTIDDITDMTAVAGRVRLLIEYMLESP